MKRNAAEWFLYIYIINTDIEILCSVKQLLYKGRELPSVGAAFFGPIAKWTSSDNAAGLDRSVEIYTDCVFHHHGYVSQGLVIIQATLCSNGHWESGRNANC